jgi:hypothetical protein
MGAERLASDMSASTHRRVWAKSVEPVCANRIGRYDRRMSWKATHRIIDLLIGIPLLLLGIFAVAVDVLLWIRAAPNPNPIGTSIVFFPMGTVCGFPFWWFGFHLTFRTSWLALVDRGLTRLFRGKPRTTNPDENWIDAQ